MLLKTHNISYLSPNNLLFGYKKSPKLEDDFAVWTEPKPMYFFILAPSLSISYEYFNFLSSLS